MQMFTSILRHDLKDMLLRDDDWQSDIEFGNAKAVAFQSGVFAQRLLRQVLTALTLMMYQNLHRDRAVRAWG